MLHMVIKTIISFVFQFQYYSSDLSGTHTQAVRGEGGGAAVCGSDNSKMYSQVFLVQVLREILPRKRCMLESFWLRQKDTTTLLSLSGLRFSLQNLNHLTHRNVLHIKFKLRIIETERKSFNFCTPKHSGDIVGQASVGKNVQHGIFPRPYLFKCIHQEKVIIYFRIVTLTALI